MMKTHSPVIKPAVGRAWEPDRAGLESQLFAHHELGDPRRATHPF